MASLPLLALGLLVVGLALGLAVVAIALPPHVVTQTETAAATQVTTQNTTTTESQTQLIGQTTTSTVTQYMTTLTSQSVTTSVTETVTLGLTTTVSGTSTYTTTQTRTQTATSVTTHDFTAQGSNYLVKLGGTGNSTSQPFTPAGPEVRVSLNVTAAMNSNSASLTWYIIPVGSSQPACTGTISGSQENYAKYCYGTATSGIQPGIDYYIEVVSVDATWQLSVVTIYG